MIVKIHNIEQDGQKAVINCTIEVENDSFKIENFVVDTSNQWNDVFVGGWFDPYTFKIEECTPFLILLDNRLVFTTEPVSKRDFDEHGRN